MIYLEYLRVRRAFLWYAVIATGLVLFVLVSILFAHGPGGSASIVIDADDDASRAAVAHAKHHALSTLGPVVPVPIAALLAVAAFCALGFATALAASFNRETQFAHFTFVQPLSRMRMAADIAAVDVAGILAAGAFALGLAFLAVTGSIGIKAHYVWDAQIPLVAALGFGAAFMWYALLQAASAWAPGEGGRYVGMTGATFGLAIPLSQASILGPIATLCGLILYIDPLAYFSTVTVRGTDVGFTGVLAYGVGLRAALVWIIGAGALALATALWRRVEV